MELIKKKKTDKWLKKQDYKPNKLKEISHLRGNNSKLKLINSNLKKKIQMKYRKLILKQK